MSIAAPLRRRARGNLAAVCLLALSACDPSMLFSGAGVVSFVATDKTLADHAVSLALDRDCSAVRSSRGESYCAPVAYEMATEHCYRTLGKVTCYLVPDPHASEAAWVIDVPEPPHRGTGLDLADIFGETDDSNKTDSGAPPARPASGVQLGTEERGRTQR